MESPGPLQSGDGSRSDCLIADVPLRLGIGVGPGDGERQPALRVIDVALDAVDAALRPFWITVRLLRPRKLN